MRKIQFRCALAFYFAAIGLPAVAIDTAEAIVIGGIRQWITLKGADNSAPVLLFLHGGPGNSALRYSDDFTGELRKKFIVVQWDQRETGKTKAMNASPVPLTVSLFENDVTEMIVYLRTRFSKEKIYLMGHSWGGFLALLTAAHHPELLEACFAISPMVWQAESERQTLAIIKGDAEKEHDAVASRELASVRLPFASGTDLYFDRKWLAKRMGQKMVAQSFVEVWAATWLPVFNEASAVNFFTEAPEIRCPVFFLVGGRDYQTYFKLTERYYEALTAPRKEIFRFPGAAHAFLSSEKKKLQEIVLQQLPLSVN